MCWYIFGNLVYFVAIWYILWPFGLFCDRLVYFVAIWYIVWLFGMLTNENLPTLARHLFKKLRSAYLLRQRAARLRFSLLGAVNRFDEPQSFAAQPGPLLHHRADLLEAVGEPELRVVGPGVWLNCKKRADFRKFFFKEVGIEPGPLDFI
jgi:hypothetical protein